MSEGDVPFFLESPKMAKFDNWVPDEESEDETSEDETSEEESEGSKPASSSDDSDDSDDYEDDVEAAAMEEEKRLKAEMVPILGGLRGGRRRRETFVEGIRLHLARGARVGRRGRVPRGAAQAPHDRDRGVRQRRREPER